MRNLVYFLYILINLTFFRGILTWIKIKGCLRPLEDISLASLPFLKFFLALSLSIRYLILVFSNIFYFLSKRSVGVTASGNGGFLFGQSASLFDCGSAKTAL